MKIVRLRARAIVALAVCALCALAVMKALSDNTNVVDEPGAPQVSAVDKQRSENRGEEEHSQKGLEGDRVPPKRSGVSKADRKAYYDIKEKTPKLDEKIEEKAEEKPRLPPVPDLPHAPNMQNQNLQDQNQQNLQQNQRENNQNPPQIIPNQNMAGNGLDHRNNLDIDRNRHIGDQTDTKRLPGAGRNTTGYPILMNGKFVPSRRIVHLDLKGAPPKLYYFEKFFQMISKLGATGILLEWEDTFPYSGELTECRSGRAYSEADVRTILGWAKANNLEVIPLVQTFGHLEWILKHPKFAHLREVDRYAQVICLSNPEAVELVKKAVDQVMALHHQLDGSEFFHMGADEAFQVGMCERCTRAIREKYNNNREKLMVNHITNIATYIKSKYNRRVLMWHDMLNNVDAQTMKETNLGELVEPVVWAYAENLNDFLMPDMWQRFSQSFPYIWSASAYKGADGPTRYYSNIPHYLQNHISWGHQMTREYKSFREFRGIILTGWQRFDHFAVLCELLPVGVPSLAVNLQVVKNGGEYNRQLVSQTSRLLECSNQLDVDSPGIAGYCQFPGSRVYQYVQQLKMSQQNLKQNVLGDYQLGGWLSPFNMVHNYSSAWYLDQIMDKLQMSVNDFVSLSKALRTELSKIFDDDTVDEFLLEYVEPEIEQLQKLFAEAQRIGKIRIFPKRPFSIISAVKRQQLQQTTPSPSSLQSQQQPNVMPPGPPADNRPN